MLTIHYSPSGPLPKNVPNFDLLIDAVGKQKAIDQFLTYDDHDTNLSTRWFLLLTIVSNQIRKGKRNHEQCQVIEYRDDREPYTLKFDHEGELLDPLFDNDEYQFKFLMDTNHE